jgi:hypothetical protein
LTPAFGCGGGGVPPDADLLGERTDADVVVVQLLADDADVVGQVVDHELLIGERLARRLGLLIQPRVDRLERLGDRAEQVLQQLRLFLQHAQVRHQLLVFFVRGGGGRGRRQEDYAEHGRQSSLCHRLTSK